MIPYNRRDNDMHKYLIPEDLLPLFDQLLEQMQEYTVSERVTNEAYWSLEIEFCDKFTQHMVG